MERKGMLERSPSKRYDVLLRMLLVGDTGVGKTCILKRFAQDDFNEQHYTTIGVDFKMKTIDVDGKIVRIQIWDTAGQERFESITQQFYRRAQGILLVYDISHRPTFLSVNKWVTCIKQLAEEDVCVALLGNKKDKDDFRQVTQKEANQLADDEKMMFFETSAKYPENLDEVLVSLCRRVLETQQEKKDDELKNKIPSDTYNSEKLALNVKDLEIKHSFNDKNNHVPEAETESSSKVNIGESEVTRIVTLKDSDTVQNISKGEKSCCTLM